MEHQVWVSVLGLTAVLGFAVLLLPAANRVNVPYTVVLAAFGVILGFVSSLANTQALGPVGDILDGLHGFNITSEVVMFVFLPALVFEAALAINVRRLLEDIAPILVLAIVGLMISTFFIGAVMSAISGVTLVACLLLGAIVSATDPVAVVAIFKDLGAPKRLAMLVEGESLFNDATAIVTFTILGAMLVGSAEAGVVAGALGFVKVFVGGGVVGYVIAQLFCAVLGRLRDLPLVEITLTISLAYLSFIVAEHYLHVSGVVAVVVAALVLGSYGRTIISAGTWHDMEETWEQIGFWANTLIFVLVGLIVPTILSGITVDELKLLAALLAAGFAARAFIIYALLPLLARLGFQSVSTAYKTVMFWGGLRGAVSLALALSVMENAAFGSDTQRFIGVLVTGFVLFTLFINATTLQALLGFLGLDKLSAADVAIRDRAIALTLTDTIEHLRGAAYSQGMNAKVTKDVIDYYDDRLNKVETSTEGLRDISEDDRVRIGLSTLSNQERTAYLKHFADGHSSSHVTRVLLGQIDDILDGLKAAGLDGYKEAVEKGLGFGFQFRFALGLQRRLGWDRMLARRLADRFEVLNATRTLLRRIMDAGVPKVTSVVGTDAGECIKTVLESRLDATKQAADALRLQYPAYEELLQLRHLGQIALRSEAADYGRMLADAVISKEVFTNLKSQLLSRERTLERRPRLDLGLDREHLVAQVPFFADLPSDRIASIATLLKPRLVLPGEKVLRKGDSGDAMYFISNGAVEVALEPDARQLGSGDFFGELSLLTDRPRNADVTATGFCDLLTLYVKDFQHLLETDVDLRNTIEKVARERLGDSESL